MEKDEAGRFHQGQASRLGLGQRKGEVDLGSRFEESLPKEEHRIAADALFYKIDGPCHKKSNAKYLTQHLCLHSLDYSSIKVSTYTKLSLDRFVLRNHSSYIYRSLDATRGILFLSKTPATSATVGVILQRLSTSKGKTSFGSCDEENYNITQETADCQMTDHTRRIRSLWAGELRY